MVPARGVDAPADLGARFSHVLNNLGGRPVSAAALFETLRLEALDWGFDQGIEAQVLDTEGETVGAGDEL